MGVMGDIDRRAALDNTSSDPTERAPLVLGGNDFASVTEKVCALAERVVAVVVAVDDVGVGKWQVGRCERRISGVVDQAAHLVER